MEDLGSIPGERSESTEHSFSKQYSTLEGEALTTEPPGKSLSAVLL